MTTSASQLSHSALATCRNSSARTMEVPRSSEFESGGVGVAGAVVEAEVGRFVRPCRGDDVPPGAAAADVVDGDEPAGEVVRLVVRRGSLRGLVVARLHEEGVEREPASSHTHEVTFSFELS
jgi:hypothetical protein